MSDRDVFMEAIGALNSLESLRSATPEQLAHYVAELEKAGAALAYAIIHARIGAVGK